MNKTKQLFSVWFMAIFGLIQIANAQTPSWKWVKWSEGTETTANSICTDASGNLYGTGHMKSSSTFDTFKLKPLWEAVFIVKYNASGTVSWAKMIENPGYLAIDGKCISKDPDGNLFVTGTYTGTIKMGTITLTGGSHFLAKYDNNGTAQWIVNTTGSNSVTANASGIYVVGGQVIQKHDATGAIVWTINGVKSNQGYTNFFSIVFKSTGNFLVAGDINDNWTFGTTLVTGGYQNIVLMEVSAAGTVSWAKTFGNSIGGSHAQQIAVDGSDNIIMTGKIGGLVTATCTFGSLSLPAKNAYLVKLNSAGVTQWGKVMTNSGDITGSGVSVITDKDDAVYVTAGTTSDLACTDGATTTFVTAMKGTNAFILKFNSVGVFQTSLTNKELATPYVNNCAGLSLTSSPAGVYFSGRAGPFSEWGTLKTTSSYGSVFAKIDGNTPVNISSENLYAHYSVYPNPSNGVFTLDLQNSLSSTYSNEINIVNFLGETVYQSDVTDRFTTLNLENLPNGIYILKIQTSKGLITKKLLKE